MGDNIGQAGRRSPDREGLFQLASGQRGHFTAAQARTFGYSHALLAYHAQTGTFRRVWTGVYRFRDYPSTPGEEIAAAWLALGDGPDGAVVSHESALALWDLTDAIPDAIHFVVPRRRRHLPRLPGAAVHTTTHPFGPEDVRHLDGLPVTVPARTLLDVVESLGIDEHLAGALARSVRRGWLTVDALEAAAARRGPRAVRLIGQLLATV
jgi:predicted transcriptional regulator of viral defense system